MRIRSVWKRRRNGEANSLFSRPTCRKYPDAGLAAGGTEIANACGRRGAGGYAAVNGGSANLADGLDPSQYDEPSRQRAGSGEIYSGCTAEREHTGGYFGDEAGTGNCGRTAASAAVAGFVEGAFAAGPSGRSRCGPSQVERRPLRRD